MRTLMLVLIVCGLICGSAVAQCEPEVTIGEFMGIPAFSNAPYTETGYGCYQCVELARRFAQVYHNTAQDGFGSVGCATGMWEILPRDYGYVAIDDNSGIVPPDVGDFIIWWQDNWDCITVFGHVAIVCEVYNDGVMVFEQNINNGTKPFRWVPRDMSTAPNWKLNNGERLGSSFQVKGWLRYPAFPQRYYQVGHDPNGYSYKEILNAYVDNGDQQALGSVVANLTPYSNGYVAEWPWNTGCLFQVFDGGSLGNCAIVYDTQNSPDKAFVLHGQLWAYYKTYGGPNIPIAGSPIGGPVDQEKYATDSRSGLTGHQLVVQEMANGWLVYDTVTGFCDARSIADPGFTIAFIPGDGQTLTLLTYAQSSTSAYLTWNPITGAVSYEAYQNGSFVGSTSATELTISNLSPSTTYTFQVKAVAASGNVLAEPDQVSVIVNLQALDSLLASAIIKIGNEKHFNQT